MYADTPGAGRPKPPLPPVRTRWKGGSHGAAGQGRGILGPVKSGLFAAFESMAPALEPESPEADTLAVPEPEPDQPWLETPRLEEYEAAELLLEVSLEEHDPMRAEPDAAEATSSLGELTLTPPEEEELPELQSIGEPLDAEALHSRPAPLSAWDLGARPAEADAEQRRLDRVREEWEALGQALVESLSSVAETMPLGQAWTTLPTPEADPPEATSVEGLEPLGAGFERVDASEPPVHGPVYDELAQRLVAFAGALRAEGRYAITRAQLSGDRLDSMLAGFAAGWLAARGE